MPLSGLAGKVAIVTGAAQGIGASVVHRLLAEGCRVAGVDRTAAFGLPDGALPIAADIASETDWDEIVAAAERALGPVDYLVNNAGVLGQSASLHEMPVSHFDEVMGINARGTLLGMRAVLRSLHGRGAGGAIVNIASIGAWRINPKRLPYAISKAAIMALTQGAAIEYGREGIRINAVAPGITETPMSSLVDRTRLLPGGQGGVDRRPIPRKGRADEVANLVAWLLSDEASYVTGSIQVIDGGAMASW